MAMNQKAKEAKPNSHWVRGKNGEEYQYFEDTELYKVLTRRIDKQDKTIEDQKKLIEKLMNKINEVAKPLQERKLL